MEMHGNEDRLQLIVESETYAEVGALARLIRPNLIRFFRFPVANFATGAIICMGSVLSLIAKRGS